MGPASGAVIACATFVAAIESESRTDWLTSFAMDQIRA